STTPRRGAPLGMGPRRARGRRRVGTGASHLRPRPPQLASPLRSPRPPCPRICTPRRGNPPCTVQIDDGVLSSARTSPLHRTGAAHRAELAPASLARWSLTLPLTRGTVPRIPATTEEIQPVEYVPTYPATSLQAAEAPDRYRRACWFGLGAAGA